MLVHFLWRRLATSLVLLAIPYQASAWAACDLHVAAAGSDQQAGSADAPFASLQRAVDEAARLCQRGQQGEVRIVLHEGVYSLREPLLIGPKHVPKGDGKLIFTAAPGAAPVISGGRALQGWRIGPNGNWSLQLSDVLAGWRFRELFVDGERLLCAGIPTTTIGELSRRFPTSERASSLRRVTCRPRWLAVNLSSCMTGRFPV